MKFVALISGGKDSFYNILHCVANGHELAALANLHPKDAGVDELDSFMFQTVGHDVIDFYSECLGGIPLFRHAIKGSSSNVQLEYSPTEADEIEDLYELLKKVKESIPEVEAVSCGAILSHYQRTRVENVCDRLGLTSLAYLWQRNQEELMREMCALGLEARLIKVAAVGLKEKHLGLLLLEALPTLLKLKAMYDVHVCGEGGEFESLVFNAPNFVKKLVKTNLEIRSDSSDTLYLRLAVEVVPKDDKIDEGLPTIPPLLSEEFAEISDSLVLSGNASENTLPMSYEGDAFTIRTSETASKVFISNVSSTLPSVEAQTEDVLNQIEALLQERGAEIFDIQHMTVLVSDMKDFAAINGVYLGHFIAKFLPPSRVCVETTLPAQSKVVMSCTVLKQGSDRLGIHIRSRSYWAPQNIGPYSQAIVESVATHKTASLSGQIPLVPSSMALVGNESRSVMHVLALQHLHRVMELINVKKIANIICYVTDASAVENIVELWSSYVDQFLSQKDQRKLSIVQTTALPRGASVEWGGLAYEIIDQYDDEDDVADQLAQLNCKASCLDEDLVSESAFGPNLSLLFSVNDENSLSTFLNNEKVAATQVSVMATLQDIAALIELGCSAEWVPVLGTWNFQGLKQKYSVIWER